jgi:hypothetical protein
MGLQIARTGITGTWTLAEIEGVDETTYRRGRVRKGPRKETCKTVILN